MPETGRHVLICGHRAFAARGLRTVLELAGHRVSEFSRSGLDNHETALRGPVTELDQHPLLAPRYDVVVNYIVLKYESIERNRAYFRSLLKMCREREVRHLIQISSMSVYPDSTRIYTESAAIREDPARCGPYAGAKLAAEIYLRNHLDPGIKRSLIRPAYVLGPDMPDPLGSVGMQLRSGEILALCRADRQRPLIGRHVLHQAVARTIDAAPASDEQVLLLVDRNSPTCRDYLQGCCEILGMGSRAVCPSLPLWAARLLSRQMRSPDKPFSWSRYVHDVLERNLAQEYRPDDSESRLKMSFATDWEQVFQQRARLQDVDTDA